MNKRIDKKKKVFSGIRATGRLHIGNYYGAIKGMIALQDEYDCTFGVMDLHTLTTPYDRGSLQGQIRDVVLDMMAAGLDPKKCRLIIQSHIPEVVELSYYFATVYQLARIEDLPTFKEKKAQYPEHVTAALLYYPILMAADILLPKAELVPVGIDQEPHMEVTREIARKFNSTYGDTFSEPQRFATKGELVPSLTGEGKMSKTKEGSFITLADSLDVIRARLAKAPTDSGVEGGSVPKKGGVANLFTLLRLFSTPEKIATFTHAYEQGKIKYTELKEQLSHDIFKELKPLQMRRQYLAEHMHEVDEFLSSSEASYCEDGRSTIAEVREKMGLS